MLHPCRLDPHEAWVLTNADRFTAVAFRGRGRYARIDCASIEEAERAAARLATPDRPAMVYAVAGRHQALIATTQEKETDTMTAKPKNKPRKTPASKPRTRKPTAAKAKPVRAGTSLAALVGFMIKGDKTFDQMAKALGLRVDQVQHRVRYVLRVGHGIGHKVGADGRVLAVLPKGMTPVTAVRQGFAAPAAHHTR